MKMNVPIKLIVTICLGFAAFSLAADSSKKKPTAPKDESPEIEKLGAPQGVSFNAANHRDPFLNPLLLIKRKEEAKDEEVSRGQPPPGIAGMQISEVKLLGISVR